MTTPNEVAEKFGFVNVDDAVEAASVMGVPLYAAFALMQMESGGQNIFGHDVGGMFSGLAVTEDRYITMTRAVANGHKSNGVGPLQLTYSGFFPDAEHQGYNLWIPLDNFKYGFKLLMSFYIRYGTWQKAGAKYNGSDSYGVLFNQRVNTWLERLKAAQPDVKKTISELAQEVITGVWGNGVTRTKALTAAGYDAKLVQSKVTQMLLKK